MALGILKVGAVLEQAGIKVDHLDLNGISNFLDVVRDYPDKEVIFALTATTPQIPAAVQIREVLIGSKVILGGPHATLVHAAAKRGNERAQKALDTLLSVFDVVVCGDGEKAVFEALDAKGLIDADDARSPLWQSSADFTASPWPARHLVDVSSYHYSIDGREGALSLVGQLGCPMSCRFCGGRNSPMLRQIRKRTPENIVAELMHLHDTYGATSAMFYDDEININKSVVDLMRLIAATGVDWRLRGFVKAELFDEQQAELMYAAGFRWLLCGFESGHPRILKNIDKKATLEDNTRMLRIAKKYGIRVKALMSAGHPGESEETIMATRDWLLREQPSDFDLTTICVYPGTGYYDDAVHIGDGVYKYVTDGDALYSQDINYNVDQAFYKGRPGEYKSFVWTDYMTSERLVTMRDEVEHEVRKTLSIPYPTSAAEINYFHSMGQGLPLHILRSSK
jgi:radical SAM superfamily enzyme YgiQ (UPF0313 family)